MLETSHFYDIELEIGLEAANYDSGKIQDGGTLWIRASPSYGRSMHFFTPEYFFVCDPV